LLAAILALFVGSDHLQFRYNGRLAARPLLTQGVTTAVLFATGDLTAQQLVEKKGLKNHDVARTGRMALYGGCKFFTFILLPKPTITTFSPFRQPAQHPIFRSIKI
jgi:hypothetical protein